MTLTDEMVLAGALAVRKWRMELNGIGHYFDPTIPPSTEQLNLTRAALTAALSDQAGGWQDISTVRKDGTSFLATMAGGDDGPYYVLFWNDRFFESVDSGEGPSMDHITHWQSLPTPPPSSTAGEG